MMRHNILVLTLGLMAVPVYCLLQCDVPSFASENSKHALPTASQQKEFDELWSKSGELIRKRKYAEALRYLKEAADIPHHPEMGEELSYINVLEKLPLDPEAHIALGIYDMNGLDWRYVHPRNDYLWGGTLAEWEFRAAIATSPNRKNEEAEALLLRLEKMRAKAKWNASDENSGFISSLVENWSPPVHDGVFITRLRVNPVTSAPIVAVRSPSNEHDETALIHLARAIRLGKGKPWHFHFIFASAPDLKVASDESYGSVGYLGYFVKLEERNKSPEKQSAERYVSEFCTSDVLKNYCTPDTVDAFKRGEYTELPQTITVCGDLAPIEGLGKVKWVASSRKDMPLLYELLVGDSWRIVIDPQKISSQTSPAELLLQQRIHDVLFSAVIEYQYGHRSAMGVGEWLSRSPATENAQEACVRNSQGRVVSYSCKLADGRTVLAELDAGQLIKSVRVNGELDAVWTRACSTKEQLQMNK